MGLRRKKGGNEAGAEDAMAFVDEGGGEATVEAAELMMGR